MKDFQIKGNNMSKQDVVQEQLSAIQAAQTQSIIDGLGAAYDAGFFDTPVSTGTFTQSDIDAAVQAAQGVDAQVLADAQAKAQSDLGEVQKALEEMTSKEQMEEQAVAAVSASIAQVQASFDAIKALFPGLTQSV